MNAQTQIKMHTSSNLKALLYLSIPSAILCFGLLLSANKIWSIQYVLGQILIGMFFFQCFILLHETGHLSFFKNKTLNKLFGHLFGFISIIPFNSWIGIHNLHHKWTGYRDKDPTTEGTVNPKFGAASRWIVNLAWLLWFPLFTIAYRLGNYWNIKKLKRFLPSKELPFIYFNMLLIMTGYTVLIYTFGPWLFHNLLLGYFIGLIISDIFILSQHSHIEIPIAGNAEVKPIRYTEQIPYTRSIDFKGTFIGRLLFFNFNLHEIHHAYPGLAAYHLDKIKLDTPNKVGFFSYVKDAKTLKGMDFIFSTSSKRIGKIISK